MKKERKEALLWAFPAVPQECMAKMRSGKYSANFVVLLANGNELFVRCFHRYYGKDAMLAERQRYVFAEDGYCRYGLTADEKSWRARSDFREPVFFKSGGYGADNSYTVLNWEALRRSCMRYSCADKYEGRLLMSYLQFYCQHPNAEYIIKSGYKGLLERCSGYWGSKLHLEGSHLIDWTSNNLLKMLGLNRAEFALLKGREELFPLYRYWRGQYPEYKPEELIDCISAFGSAFGTAQSLEHKGIKIKRLSRYITAQEISLRDYDDYVRQCETLKYNLSDTAICYPHNFGEMHTRLSQIIEYAKKEEAIKSFAALADGRRQLEFSTGKYIIRQPVSMDEIIAEGKALSHCVGGYAERHANGALTIMFLRRKSSPDKPYYTIEVSNSGKIVQCRGYKNNRETPKPEAVQKAEGEYQNYLDSLFMKVRISA